MISKKFNLKRYQELIKLDESGKISLLDANFLELLDYSTSVSFQLTYDRRKDYFLLIEKYLNKTLSLIEFRTQFTEMRSEDSKKACMIRQNLEELEVFYLADDLEEFSNLIGDISMLCLEYDETWDGTMKRMSESEFYSWLNKYYFQLAELFPVVSTNNLPYENLISRSLKNLAVIIVLGSLLIFCTILNIN